MVTVRTIPYLPRSDIQNAQPPLLSRYNICFASFLSPLRNPARAYIHKPYPLPFLSPPPTSYIPSSRPDLPSQCPKTSTSPPLREAKSPSSTPHTLVADLFLLKERTITITGAAGFLGSTLATAILQSGADVIALDLLPAPPASSWDEVEAAAKEHGAQVKYVQCDTTDEAKVKAAFQAFVPTLRWPIRGLVACAGISDNGPAVDFPVASIRRMLDVNVTGTFLVAQAVAREMTRAEIGGGMVLVASMSGYVANKGVDTAGYNSSKAAVQQRGRGQDIAGPYPKGLSWYVVQHEVRLFYGVNGRNCKPRTQEFDLLQHSVSSSGKSARLCVHGDPYTYRFVTGGYNAVDVVGVTCRAFPRQFEFFAKCFARSCQSYLESILHIKDWVEMTYHCGVVRSREMWSRWVRMWHRGPTPHPPPSLSHRTTCDNGTVRRHDDFLTTTTSAVDSSKQAWASALPEFWDLLALLLHPSSEGTDLPEAVLAGFRDLLSENGGNDRYGLTLVHRHANVAPGKRLMDFGRTLQPWNIPDTAEDLHRASIAPKSFASRDNRWKPYEYEIAPAENENLALLAEIAMLLESYGCEDVLGIRKFSPTDPEELEITESEGISIKIPWIPVRVIRWILETS
ncbi:hypothetical protein KVT40_007386 [Elsinoe batatas]|uniref:Ketoreductase domain-containing protein n=1 Tax=Elsinoe batatas TaxID=2601811 RepID=A0A8K0KUU4_9PEZI|nr:hypothetical protein KVT40_007386 [Elsinoe batatas]